MLDTASSRNFWWEAISEAISCSTVRTSAGADSAATGVAATGAAVTGAAAAGLDFLTAFSAEAAATGVVAAVTAAAGASDFFETRLAAAGVEVVLLIVLLPVVLLDIFKRVMPFTGTKKRVNFCINFVGRT
jgi:hypothetical protein